MPDDEIEQVLANWIREANSPEGKLVDGVDPANWVAKRFLEWWKDKAVASALDECATCIGLHPAPSWFGSAAGAISNWAMRCTS